MDIIALPRYDFTSDETDLTPALPGVPLLDDEAAAAAGILVADEEELLSLGHADGLLKQAGFCRRNDPAFWDAYVTALEARALRLYVS